MPQARAIGDEVPYPRGVGMPASFRPVAIAANVEALVLVDAGRVGRVERRRHGDADA